MSRTTLAAALVVTTVVGGVGVGAILKAQPLVAGDEGRFGPPAVNRMLGFNLFPGPVQLPGADPFGARSWGVTVGSGAGPSMTYVGFTARSVIREAYGLGAMPILDAPRWMDGETFDLTVPGDLAIVDGVPDYEQVHDALRKYLETQLGLTTHREMRTFPAYAMVLANSEGRLGASLRPSTADCIPGGPPGGPSQVTPGVVGPVLYDRQLTRRLCGIDNNIFGFTGLRVTIKDLAREFEQPQYPLSPGREIVDRTGLSGTYDFDLRFGLLPLAAIGNANYRVGRVFEMFGVRSLFTALPEQLGLKLVDTTLSREVLVIDQINRPN